MSNWRVLYTKEGLSVGMWKDDGKVYITIDKPEDTMDQDIEIEFTLEELEKILAQAKAYEKEIADD